MLQQLNVVMGDSCKSTQKGGYFEYKLWHFNLSVTQ